MLILVFIYSTSSEYYNSTESDVNECSLGTHDCAAEATCTDTDGSYTCTCNTGYDGDGTDCLSKNFVSILLEYSWFGNV